MNKRSLKKSEVSEIFGLNRGFEPIVLDFKNISNYDEKSKIIINNKNKIKLMTDNNVVILKNINPITFEKYENIFDILEIKLSTEYRPGIAPRKLKSNSGKSFSSTEATKELCILPHNEMAYSNYRPSIISFWCRKKPKKFGETPLFSCSRIYDLLSPKLKNKLSKPVFFNRLFTNIKTKWDRNSNIGGSMWKNSFGTKNKNKIEKYCKKIGMNYHWDNDKLFTKIKIQQIIFKNNKKYVQLQTPLLGKDVYFFMKNKFSSRFNNRKFDKIIELENYSPPIKYSLNKKNTELFSKNEINEFMNCIFKTGIVPKWEKGDIWIINNIKFAHSRMNVDIPEEREIIASLGEFIDVRIYNSP